eukprot:gene5818-8024_t
MSGVEFFVSPATLATVKSVNQREQFRLKISNNVHKLDWEIELQIHLIKNLDAKLLPLELSTTTTFPKCPIDSDLNLESICNFLNEIIVYYGREIWRISDFLELIDNEPNKSMVTKLQLNRLNAQISHLSQKLHENQNETEKNKRSISNLYQIIEELRFGNHSNELETVRRASNVTDPDRRLSIISSISSESSVCDENKSPTIKEAFNNQNNSYVMYNDGGVTDKEVDELPSEDVVNNLDQQLAAVEYDNRYVEEQSKENELSNSKFLPNDLFLSDELAIYYNHGVEEILQSMQPHQSQVLYRSSAFGSVKKLVRKVVNSNSFQTDLFEIRCFLPDDPIRVLAVVSKQNHSTWQSLLLEKLAMFSDRAAASNGNYGILDEEDQHDEWDEFKPLVNHVIQHATIVSAKVNTANHKIVFNVDSLEVEISTYNSGDLCMIAFVEELDVVVGQDHLLKRSILLIRSWWAYETLSYVGSYIRNYLSDFSLIIMVCEVFNLYSKHIKTPLQALCLFLSEFSNYDGANQVITLQGIVPFKSQLSNQPQLNPIRSNHIISAALIEKYWLAFNVASTSITSVDVLNTVDGVVNVPPISSASSDEFPSSFNTLNMNSFGNIDCMDINEISLNKVYLANTLPTVNTVQYFDRFGFNILHPFNHTNMVIEKISNRKLARITKAFQTGALNLGVLLKQTVENQHTSQIIFKNFFPSVCQRFGEDWRPDALGNTIKNTTNTPIINGLELLTSSLETMWNSIQYSNLILDSVVSETALLTLSMEILVDKGPLPVGEIGKVLAEISSISNLSTKLKEHFGGLKKFLEKFPDKFVLSNDHPFNPHVLLRSLISPQHLEMIDRGIYPPQLTMKMKKVASSKKKKSHSIPGIGFDPNLHKVSNNHQHSSMGNFNQNYGHNINNKYSQNNHTNNHTNNHMQQHHNQNIPGNNGSAVAGLFNNQNPKHFTNKPHHGNHAVSGAGKHVSNQAPSVANYVHLRNQHVQLHHQQRHNTDGILRHNQDDNILTNIQNSKVSFQNYDEFELPLENSGLRASAKSWDGLDTSHNYINLDNLLSSPMKESPSMMMSALRESTSELINTSNSYTNNNSNSSNNSSLLLSSPEEVLQNLSSFAMQRKSPDLLEVSRPFIPLSSSNQSLQSLLNLSSSNYYPSLNYNNNNTNSSPGNVSDDHLNAINSNRNSFTTGNLGLDLSGINNNNNINININNQSYF